MDPMLTLAPGLCQDRDALIGREWLVTNGIGGYALGSVAGVCTRAYHGYLVAATAPPVGRTLLLQHLVERVRIGEKTWLLSGDEWADGRAAPEQWRAHSTDWPLEHFALDGTLPVWTYQLGTVRLIKRVWMAAGQNTTYIQYTLLDAPHPAQVDVLVSVNDRDHHDASHDDGTTWQVDQTEGGWILSRLGMEQAQPWSLLSTPTCDFAPVQRWSEPLYLRVEAERGLEAVEQRYELATLSITINPGASWTLIASTEGSQAIVRDPQAALASEQKRQAALLAEADAVSAPLAIRQLILAADQCIVTRTVDVGGRAEAGQSVIAGYPWFGDWGRDTMISLPGLCLATRRYTTAATILRTFARFVSQGMLPNRFPDVGEEPEYNTVDATLWYFHALDQYQRVTNDNQLVQDLLPTLAEIIDWHLRGTRYGIVVDPADGLLWAGEPGAQLTWMDVRIDAALLQKLEPELFDRYLARGVSLEHGLVVTPRHGKAVEINALWYNALQLMTRWAQQYDETITRQHDYHALAEQVKASYSRFWYADGGYLYDVLDTPTGDDATLRPNQVIALAVAPELLPLQQRRSALAVVTEYLWTPAGLRTLDPRHPDYQPRFTGNRVQRDIAYHQGTIWPWLIGPYLDARQRLEPELDLRPFVQPLLDHLWDFGLGTVAEVFDAEPPRLGAGCFAQAWSIAALLTFLKS